MAAHGAAKVSVYVTHAVFPKHSYERFTHKDDGNSSSIFVDDTSEILIANLCISNSNECYQRPGNQQRHKILGQGLKLKLNYYMF